MNSVRESDTIIDAEYVEVGEAAPDAVTRGSVFMRAYLRASQWAMAAASMLMAVWVGYSTLDVWSFAFCFALAVLIAYLAAATPDLGQRAWGDWIVRLRRWALARRGPVGTAAAFVVAASVAFALMAVLVAGPLLAVGAILYVLWSYRALS